MTASDSSNVWLRDFVARNGKDKPVLAVLAILAGLFENLTTEQIKLLQREIPSMIESGLKWEETHNSRS